MLNDMLMEKMGYILSEVPVLLLVVWFAVRLFQFRRRRNKRPLFSETDRQLLFGGAKNSSTRLRTYLKLFIAVLATVAAASVEMMALAPFGSAILTGALLLTSAAIVHQLLPLDEQEFDHRADNIS